MGQSLTVHAAPHPLRMASVDIEVPFGLTLAEIVKRIQPKDHLRGRVIVYIGADFVPVHKWDSIRPKMGALVNIRILPGKGSGKSPLATILSLAVTIAAPYVGGILGGAIGGGFWVGSKFIEAATIWTAAASVVGKLAVSAIAPPSKPKEQSLGYANTRSSPALYINGARNEMYLYAPVSRVLGFVRVFPKLAAKNYSEINGDDQYVRQLFNFGYGELDVSERKIGDTLISDFQDVEIESSSGDDADEAPVFSIYPQSATQSDLSIALTYVGGWQVQTTPDNVNEIQCDYVFPNGLYYLSDNGALSTGEVDLEFAYSPVGAGTWTSFALISVSAARTSVVRGTARVQVPVGKYDVRVRRESGDTDSERIVDLSYWSALRTLRPSQPILHKGVAADAVRIRASDQLNGSVDRYNALCKSVCLDWDYATETWIKRVTNNPASLYRLVLQDRANAQPVSDSKVDLAQLQKWHDFCRVKGYTFNAEYDFETSLGRVLDDIAAAGRASPHRIDGLYTVVIDDVQTVPRQHITPRNSWGYKFERNFPSVPHGFRVPFNNELKGYTNDERIVYDDGFNESNASVFEQIEFFGVTNPDQIYKHGREHIASVRLRPFLHIFSCDAECLVINKGDLFRFSHDVILAGIGAGRVVEVIKSGDPEKITSIRVDEEWEMEAGKIYGVRVRLEDGSELSLPVQTEVVKTSILSFLIPQELNVGLAEEDLVMFGERGLETIDLVVHSISYSDNLTATVRALDAAPEIFNASIGVIPDFTSQSTVPLDLVRPVAPDLVEIQSGESVMFINSDGSLISRMVVSLKNNNAGKVEPVVKYRLSNSGLFSEAVLSYASPDQVVLMGLQDGQSYDLKIFYRRPNQSGLVNNIYSEPLVLNGIVFEGASSVPDDVSNFRAVAAGDVVILSWNPVSNIDFSYYQIRFTPVFDGVTWGSAQILREKVTGDNILIPLQIGSYLIKAFDRSGYSSEHEAITSTAAQALSALNVTETITESPTFSGVKTNCTVSGGLLSLTDPSLLEGVYEFDASINLGAVYTARVVPWITAYGDSLSDSLSSWGVLSSVGIISGATVEDWVVRAQIALSDLSSGAYGDWNDLVVGDYSFYRAKFRVLLKTLNPSINPVVSGLSLNVDMPDRFEDGYNVSVPSGGLTITYSPAFMRQPSVQINIINGQSGDYKVFSGQSASGFTIRIYNSSGSPVARSIDWFAKGYGRVQ